MNDETTGGSGAANTPPFPRPPYDPDAPLPPPQDRGTGGESPEGEAPRHGAREPGAGRRRQGGAGRSRPEGVSRMSEELGRRAQRTVYHGLGHLADQLEDAAARVDQLADERLHALGPRVERVAGAAGSAAGWLHGAADYLRSSELSDIQADLERQVREKPLQSLLLAAGTGWLLGKIIR